MLKLKIIKNNKIVYTGNVKKVYVNANNLGLVELQQGCANAMYKIHDAVKFISDESKEYSVDFSNAVVSVTADIISIIDI